MLFLAIVGTIGSNACEAANRTVTPQMSQTQIQEILDSADAGETVNFATGTYRVACDLVVREKDRVTLRARGAVTIVCANPRANVITVVDSTNVALVGLHLTHKSPSDGTACVGHVVFVSGGKNTEIRKCDLDGCGATGIYAYTHNVTVSGCHIHSCSIRPIRFSGQLLMVRKSVLESKDQKDFIAVGGPGSKFLYVGKNNVKGFSSSHLQLQRTQFVLRPESTQRQTN